MDHTLGSLNRTCGESRATDPESIRSFAEEIKRDYPRLNVIIHNAGINKLESVRSGDTAAAEAIVPTNLLGPIRRRTPFSGQVIDGAGVCLLGGAAMGGPRTVMP